MKNQELEPATWSTDGSKKPTSTDAMTAYPLTISPKASLADAVALMVDHHVRHLPVVDDTGSIVGLLAERDVRTVVGDPVHFRTQRGATPRQCVGDIMQAPAPVIAFDRPISEVARRFADERLEAAAVTDRFGALIGIVSYVDVLRVLA